MGQSDLSVGRVLLAVSENRDAGQFDGKARQV